MARKKYIKRKSTRKYGKRKSKVMSGGPLSLTMRSKMRYNEQITITPVTGLVGSYIFRTNSLTDPNLTGVGHQPRGYDQLMSLYDHYTVIGAKITARFFISSTQPTVVGITVKDDSVGLTDPEDYMESRVLKTRSIGARGASQSICTTLSMSINPNRFLGIRNPMSSALVRGAISASPVESAYFHLFAFDPTGDTPGAVSVDVTIDFTAVLTEPQQPTKS